MTYKTNESDSMSVYAAGVWCSLMAWLFPMTYLAIGMEEYPWPARVGIWIVGMFVMCGASWAGAGMALGIVLMHVMGAMG